MTINTSKMNNSGIDNKCTSTKAILSMKMKYSCVFCRHSVHHDDQVHGKNQLVFEYYLVQTVENLSTLKTQEYRNISMDF